MLYKQHLCCQKAIDSYERQVHDDYVSCDNCWRKQCRGNHTTVYLYLNITFPRIEANQSRVKQGFSHLWNNYQNNETVVICGECSNYLSQDLIDIPNKQKLQYILPSWV